MNIVPYLIDPSLYVVLVLIVVALTTIILVTKNHAAIRKALTEMGRKVFTRAGFFWAVNLIFMAVSVLHAGIFFGITGNGHDLPGLGQYLGFAVSFFLDLVTIILMQAMLEARYRGEGNRARQFLFFITVCCSTSTFANLAISLNDFDAHVFLPHAPMWIQVASPYVLASFPLFVIMMSLAAEMILHVRPLDKLAEEEYEADEKKRLKIMQIRNTYLQKQAEEELRALTIRAQMRANRQLKAGLGPGTFRWFWEKPPEIDSIIAGVSRQMQELYEPQIAELQQHLEEIQRQANDRYQGVARWWQNAEPTGEIASVGATLSQTKQEPVEASPSTDRPTGLYKASHSKGRANHSGDTLETQKTGSMFSMPFPMEVIKRYPKVGSIWLERGVKSVSLEDIVEVTGHSKRLVSSAPLQRTTRNKDLIRVTSVLEWLKTAPLPDNREKREEEIVEELNGRRDEVLAFSTAGEGVR